MAHTILLVEDDVWLSELYKDVLETSAAAKVLIAHSAEAALSLLDSTKNVALIVLDMFLPEHNGVEFLHEIASYDDVNDIPIIVLSSIYQHDFKMSDQRWKQYGVNQYLYKPETKPQQLVAAIKKELARGSAA